MTDVKASGPGIGAAYTVCVCVCVAAGGGGGDSLPSCPHRLPVVPTQPLNMDLCLRTGGTGSALIRRDECVCLESASKGDSRPPPLHSPLPRTASASSLPPRAGRL